MLEAAMTTSRLMSALQIAARAGVAAGASVAIARSLHLGQAVPALIAAVIVMDGSPTDTRRLAFVRVAGTILGALIGAALGQWLGSSPWVIGLGVLASVFLSNMLRLQPASQLAGYTCGIVLINSSGGAWTYAGGRLIETLIGITIAVLVSSVPRLIPARDGHA
jgi:uncharacterized membrane protein YgaE (UPF0421/DUF939 family)